MPRKPTNKSLKAKAWRLFSEYIRLSSADSDGNCTCYTCGVVLPALKSGMQAGHVIAGRGGYVLFNESLVKPQCYGCNVGAGGRYEVSIPKWVRENSLGEYEEHVRESKKPFKRTKTDYLDLIAYYEMRLEGLRDAAQGETEESDTSL